MKKHFLWLGFYAVAQLACSCRHKEEEVVPTPVQPAATRTTNPLASNYDTIARANGHWEWNSWAQLGPGRRSPATEGYTRQLVFHTNLRLVIKHNGQPYDSVAYQFPTNLPSTMPGYFHRGTLVYQTPELHLVNNERKYFRAIADYQGTLTLSVEGEYAYVDGGAYESYYWVNE